MVVCRCVSPDDTAHGLGPVPRARAYASPSYLEPGELLIEIAKHTFAKIRSQPETEQPAGQTRRARGSVSHGLMAGASAAQTPARRAAARGLAPWLPRDASTAGSDGPPPVGSGNNVVASPCVLGRIPPHAKKRGRVPQAGRALCTSRRLTRPVRSGPGRPAGWSPHTRRHRDGRWPGAGAVRTHQGFGALE